MRAQRHSAQARRFVFCAWQQLLYALTIIVFHFLLDQLLDATEHGIVRFQSLQRRGLLLDELVGDRGVQLGISGWIDCEASPQVHQLVVLLQVVLELLLGLHDEHRAAAVAGVVCILLRPAAGLDQTDGLCDTRGNVWRQAAAVSPGQLQITGHPLDGDTSGDGGRSRRSRRARRCCRRRRGEIHRILDKFFAAVTCGLQRTNKDRQHTKRKRKRINIDKKSSIDRFCQLLCFLLC